MDKNSAARLDRVHPELKNRVSQLLFNLQNLGMDVRVVQGLRTFAEQDRLYNQPRDGRDNDGDGKIDERDEKVTNARGGESNHNYGLAVDLCKFKNGQPDWNDLKAFQTIGREAKALGLEWGGDWKFVDRPHIQLKGMSVKECQKAFKEGGLNRVWARMYEILGGSKPQSFFPEKDDLLEFGDKGSEVAALQNQLAKLNLMHAHEVDGYFGKITKNAVIGFQRRHNLTADGIVGPGTKAKLRAVLEAEQKIFATLSETETESAVAPLTEKIKDAGKQVENVVPGGGSIVEETFNKTGSVVESMTEKIETAGKRIEKTVTEKTDIFNPKNIPAFIPRFGKQWLLGLVPGAGFVSTIVAYVQNAPQWLIFLFGALTGIALWNFGQLVVKHREKVVEFITECYKATADPSQNNLIPTDAKGFVGQRQNELLSSLQDLSKSGAG